MNYLSKKFEAFFEKHGYLYEDSNFWEASKVYILRMAILILMMLLFLVAAYFLVKIVLIFPLFFFIVGLFSSLFLVVKLSTAKHPRPGIRD